MSVIPPEQLDGPNLIAQFIIEYRGRGHFLPYDDNRFITKWLQLAGSADELRQRAQPDALRVHPGVEGEVDPQPTAHVLRGRLAMASRGNSVVADVGGEHSGRPVIRFPM